MNEALETGLLFIMNLFSLNYADTCTGTLYAPLQLYIFIKTTTHITEPSSQSNMNRKFPTFMFLTGWTCNRIKKPHILVYTSRV